MVEKTAYDLTAPKAGRLKILVQPEIPFQRGGCDSQYRMNWSIRRQSPGASAEADIDAEMALLDAALADPAQPILRLWRTHRCLVGDSAPRPSPVV